MCVDKHHSELNCRCERTRDQLRGEDMKPEVVAPPSGASITLRRPVVLMGCVLLALLEGQAHSITPTGRSDVIQLENGATTYVSSLEQFLAQSSVAKGNENNSSTLASSADQSAPTASKLARLASRRQDELDLFFMELTTMRPIIGQVSSQKPQQTTLDTPITSSTIYTTTTAATATTTTTTTATTNSASSSQNEEDLNKDRKSSTTTNIVTLPNGQKNVSHHHQHQHQHQHHQTHSDTGSKKAKSPPQHWQVKSLLNVTHDYPLAYSRLICGYVWPLMALITLFTNFMIVFVLTQRDMRTPTNVVLTAIAIADIIPIVAPVPWFVYLFALGNEHTILYPPLTCYIYQHSTRSVSEIFYFLSTWLNLLLAIQDYLTACWPRLARRYCQTRAVVAQIITLTLLALVLNLPQLLKLVYKPVDFYYNGQLVSGCKALQAKWFKDLIGEYVALYDDIFTAIIVLFVDGGPALALITLTALLVRQLQRQRIRGLQLMEQARTASKRRLERHRQQEIEASAKVMIFVLLAFLAVKIPFATTYTLMIIQSRFGVHFVDSMVDFQKAVSIIDFLFVISYPLNFTIFCCCSKKFRHKCAQLLDRSRAARQSWLSDHRRSTLDSQVSGELAARRSTLGSLFMATSLSEANEQAKRPLLEVSPPSLERSTMVIEEDTMDPSTPHTRPQLLDRPSKSDELRALAERGSLCYECIVRYEQLKCPSQVPLNMDQLLVIEHDNEDDTDHTVDEKQNTNRRSTGPLRLSTTNMMGGPLIFKRDFSELTRSSNSLGNQETSMTTTTGAGSKCFKRRTVRGNGRVLSDPGIEVTRSVEAVERCAMVNMASGVAANDGQTRAPDQLLRRQHMSRAQRSFSLSNSKLTTLPNATGRLADVLVRALLPGAGVRLESTRESKAPHEP